jgi:ATP phosphoribosyltransferase
VSAPLVIALPSKGRLKEQVYDWLVDCGLPLRPGGGDRGYSGGLDGLADVEARLIAAADIPDALRAGDVHLGVTGEDLLREKIPDLEAYVLLLQALGFGRADVVVAAPRSWLDMATMADVDEVAHLVLARTGRRLRVATKYLRLTRAFFARHGVVDYRIVESGGATEGAPAAGVAELVVDITTTGATLAANGLKPLADGLILASEAQLAASLQANWDERLLEKAGAFVRIVEARARARRTAAIAWPARLDAAAAAALARLGLTSTSASASGLIIETSRILDAANALASRGVGPVTVTHPAYVFEATSAAMARLETRLRELDRASSQG